MTVSPLCSLVWHTKHQRYQGALDVGWKWKSCSPTFVQWPELNRSHCHTMISSLCVLAYISTYQIVCLMNEWMNEWMEEASYAGSRFLNLLASENQHYLRHSPILVCYFLGINSEAGVKNMRPSGLAFSSYTKCYAWKFKYNQIQEGVSINMMDHQTRRRTILL